MRAPTTGIIAGALIGVVWVLGGFAAVMVVAFCAAIGGVVEAVLGGRVDLTGYLGHQHDEQ